MTSSTFSRIGAIAILGALLVVLTGCGPVNAGSAGAEKFEEFVSALADVQDVSASGSNTLPFRGSVSAAVTVDPQLSDERMRELANELGAYMNGQTSTSYLVQLERGLDSVRVEDNRALNDAIFAIYGEARAAESFVSVRLESYEGWLVVSTAGAVIPGFDRLFSAASRHGTQWHTTASDTAESLIVNARDARPDAAIEVYEAVRAQYDVLYAMLGEELVELRLVGEDTVEPARALAEQVWEPLDPKWLEINGGIVTRTGFEDFTAVDSIIADILELPGISRIDAEPDGLQIYVEDLAVLGEVEARVAASPEAASLRYVSFRSSAGVIPEFAIYATGTERSSFIPTVTALLAEGYLVSVGARQGDASLQIEVGEYDPTRMATFAAALKAATPVGTEIVINADDAGAGFGIRFVAAQRLSADDIDSFLGAHVDDFVAAWNAVG